MSDSSRDVQGRLLAERIQAELARRGFKTMTARYEPDAGCVLVGPVVLDAARHHEIYYPITLECSAIVEDVISRAEDEPHAP